MASRDRLALEAHPAPQQLLTDTDLGGHVSHWAAGLNHQAGSLLPKLRGVLATLARHTDILPAGPVVPPVRCPPSGVNPTRAWGWRASSRSLATHLVKQRQFTGTNGHGAGQKNTTVRKRSAPVRDWFNPNLLNVGQEGVVCSHALRGGDWMWLA